MMKALSLAILLASSVASTMAFADNQTVSVGYAQSKVQDFKNIRGVNLQYRYEFISPVSVVASLTYMKGDQEQNNSMGSETIVDRADVKYYSLLVGPAYRFNEYVSLYALGGVAQSKANANSQWLSAKGEVKGNGSMSLKSTSFAYGFGVAINPVNNFAINIGYEGTKVSLDGNRSINGFNVSLGYRF
jgi:putative virulence related protein PagC